jgi:hypothetical protein
VGDSGSLTSGLLFLPLLQNIINMGFANADMTREIVSLLAHIRALPKFRSSADNEIKLQQILLLLVSKNSLSLKTLQCAHSILNILMALDNSRNRNLWTKTLAIITQISLLFMN